MLRKVGRSRHETTERPSCYSSPINDCSKYLAGSNSAGRARFTREKSPDCQIKKVRHIHTYIHYALQRGAAVTSLPVFWGIICPSLIIEKGHVSVFKGNECWLLLILADATIQLN